MRVAVTERAAPLLPPTPPAGPAHRPAAAPRLVGRDSELARLLDAVAAPPALVLIEGETGVGKTALVEAALRQPALRAVTRLVGQCRPLHEPLPLMPVLEAVAGLAGRLRPDRLNPGTGALRALLPELAEVLPPPPDPLPGRAAEQQRVFRALAALLEAAGPALLVLEDVHWADGVTDEFLGFLSGSVPAGVAVVVSYRPEDLRPHGAGWLARSPAGLTTARIGLEPMDRAQVAELVRALLGADEVSDEFAAFLHERTAGLPFAVEELLALLQERRKLVHTQGRWLRRGLDEIDVPAGVRATVLARLQQLSGAAQRAAEALAVLARARGTATVAGTAGLDEDDVVTGLDELFVARLLREAGPGLWEFRHALARQAVAEATPAPRRAWLHGRAARCLEEMDPPPFVALARHYREAGEVEDWVRCAEAAADLAASVGDHGAVVTLLHDLVTSGAVDMSARSRLAIAYGMAAGHARDHRRAATALRELLDEPGLDPTAGARIRLRLGLLLVQGGHPGEARKEVATAVEGLPDHPDEAARGMCNLGYPWLGDSHLDEHVGWLERAADLARRAGNDYIVAAARADRAFVRVAAGHPDGWRDAQQLLADGTTPAMERLRLTYNLAYALVPGGHVRRARVLLDGARRIAGELADQRFGPPVAGVALWADWAAGAWDGLDARARALAETGSDSPTAATVARLVEAALRAAGGDVDGGIDALRRVTEDALGAGEQGPFVHAGAELARVAASVGRHDEALAAARRGLDLVRAKGLWPWAGELVPWAVQSLLATGAHGDASALVGELAERLRGLDAPAARAGLVHARGLLAEAGGETTAAADLLRQAQEAWDALPRPHLAALAAAHRGRLVSATDRDGGVAMLQGAARRLAQSGSRRDAALVNRWLRELGVRPAQRRGRRGYGAALSPREREVAELAVAGLSNPEIADRLVLSPRTVDRHISNVLRKLGVASRDAIVLPERTAD